MKPLRRRRGGQLREIAAARASPMRTGTDRRRLNGPDEPEETRAAAGSQDVFSNALDSTSPLARPRPETDFVRETVRDGSGSSTAEGDQPLRAVAPSSIVSSARSDDAKRMAWQNPRRSTAFAGPTCGRRAAAIDSVVDAVPPLSEPQPARCPNSPARFGSRSIRPRNRRACANSTVKPVTDLAADAITPLSHRRSRCAALMSATRLHELVTSTGRKR